MTETMTADLTLADAERLAANNPALAMAIFEEAWRGYSLARYNSAEWRDLDFEFAAFRSQMTGLAPGQKLLHALKGRERFKGLADEARKRLEQANQQHAKRAAEAQIANQREANFRASFAHPILRACKDLAKDLAAFEHDLTYCAPDGSFVAAAEAVAQRIARALREVEQAREAAKKAVAA